MKRLQQDAAKALLALVQTDRNSLSCCQCAIQEAIEILSQYELAFPAQDGCAPILLVPHPLAAERSELEQAILKGQTLWAVGLEGDDGEFGMLAGPRKTEAEMREFLPFKPQDRTDQTCLIQLVPDDQCKSVETVIVARWDLENDEWKDVV